MNGRIGMREGVIDEASAGVESRCRGRRMITLPATHAKVRSAFTVGVVNKHTNRETRLTR